jgi:hypothetical protein
VEGAIRAAIPFPTQVLDTPRPINFRYGWMRINRDDGQCECKHDADRFHDKLPIQGIASPVYFRIGRAAASAH